MDILESFLIAWIFSDADDSVSKGQVPKVSMSSPVSLPKISIPREDMPKWAAGEDSEALPKKIPTLKIKIGWMDSLVSVGSDEAEFKSKFETKAAMKEVTAADMEASKKILEEEKVFAAKNKIKPPYVSSDKESIMEVDADINNDFLLVPQRKAASKAQKKEQQGGGHEEEGLKGF